MHKNASTDLLMSLFYALHYFSNITSVHLVLFLNIASCIMMHLLWIAFIFIFFLYLFLSNIFWDLIQEAPWIYILNLPVENFATEVSFQIKASIDAFVALHKYLVKLQSSLWLHRLVQLLQPTGIDFFQVFQCDSSNYYRGLFVYVCNNCKCVLKLSLSADRIEAQYSL